MTRLQGSLYNDAGTAIQGATVTALEAGTTTTIGSTDTTDANGLWQFTSGLTGKNVDIKIQSGSSIRYLKHSDHIQVEHAWIRSDTAAGTAPLRVENATNSASNLLLELVGDNSTRADNDEIKVHFSLDNDAGEETIFARITAEANDVSNGTEDGELKFGVMVSGTLTDVFTINSSTAGVTDMNLDVSGDLTLDADGGDIFFKDGGTTFGSATNSSGNLIIKSGTTTALTFTGADVAVAGDLTISGDDLKMATNTDTYILVADGTSYNPVAVSGDVTISNAGAITIANDAVESGMLNDNIISGQTEITSGLADADELLYSDGGTVKRVGLDTLSTKILSGTVTTATDATNSDHVLVTDNESTNEENLVTFVEDATNSTGNVGLEMDGNLTYNPSSGTLTATAFAGNITGTLTGNATGTAATVTGGTQAAITTLANLTTSGALNAGSITSGFTSIDVGSGTIDTTGAVSTGDLSPAGDVAIADAKVIKLGGARPADDEPATNNTGYGIVVLFDAGAAVAVGDAVSVDTNGRVIKTVADATGTLSGPCIGIATTAAGSADDDVYVMTHGIFRHDDWGLTAGSAAFVEEDDPGDLSATAPNDDGDYVQRVGVAVKDDVLLVMPSIDVIEHTGA